MKILIDKIKAGKRMRSDLGDISELKESIRKYGLIAPITLSQKLELLAGYRRLKAAQELGWTEIECNIVTARTALEKLEIEVDENILRKNFNLDELEKIREKKEELQARGIMKLYYLLRSFWNWIKSLF